MKVGIVIPNTPRYSETFFISKITGLQEQGVHVRLYCQNKNDGFDLCPVIIAPKVTSNPLLQGVYFIKEFLLLVPFFKMVLYYSKLERKEGTGFLRLVKKIYLNAHLLKAKLDWLHFGFATQALGSETVAEAIGAKMAVSFRGFDVNVYPIKHPNVYGDVWKQIDKVHSISIFLLEKAYVLGLPKETPFKIINPAVALQHIPNKKVSKNNNPIKIITVARLHYIKGIDVLLETAALLREKEVNFTWEVIGEGTKQDMERYLYHRYQLGLENRVHFTGKQPHQEAVKAIAHSDVYVQTSLTEGFCNSVLEAQACGTIPIAFATGGLLENIKNGQTGFLVEAISADALSTKIIEVLSLKKEEKKKISRQAVERVKQEFTIENQQQEFIDFYS